MGEEFVLVVLVVVVGFGFELHEDQVLPAAQGADDEPGDAAAGVAPGGLTGGGLGGLGVTEERFEGGVEVGLGLGRDDHHLECQRAAGDGVGPGCGAQDLLELGVMVL